MRNTQGQGLVDFILGAAIVATGVLGASAAIRQAWLRARCAHLAFEATHARLVGRRFAPAGADVRLLEEPSLVRGEARCGSLREQVELPRLEPETP